MICPHAPSTAETFCRRSFRLERSGVEGIDTFFADGHVVGLTIKHGGLLWCCWLWLFPEKAFRASHVETGHNR